MMCTTSRGTFFFFRSKISLTWTLHSHLNIQHEENGTVQPLGTFWIIRKIKWCFMYYCFYCISLKTLFMSYWIHFFDSKPLTRTFWIVCSSVVLWMRVGYSLWENTLDNIKQILKNCEDWNIECKTEDNQNFVSIFNNYTVIL